MVFCKVQLVPYIFNNVKQEKSKEIRFSAITNPILMKENMSQANFTNLRNPSPEQYLVYIYLKGTYGQKICSYIDCSISNVTCDQGALSLDKGNSAFRY